MNKKSVKRGLLPYIFLLLIILAVFYIFNIVNVKNNDLTYDEFISEINKGTVEEINIVPKESAMVYQITGKLKGYEENETFSVKVPLSDSIIGNILANENEVGFKVTTKEDPSSSTLVYLLWNILPLVILVVFAFVLFSKQMGSAGKSMDFGKRSKRIN